MIETSAEINEIATACAKVQAELENVGKGGTNPHFKSKYATLPDVLDAVRDKYAAQGVAIWQCPVNCEGSNIGVVTRLAHSSGQWIQSTLYVAPGRFDAQGAGSVITYLRRYALMAMAGVSAEDDDGNAAVARPEPTRPTTPAPLSGPPQDLTPGQNEPPRRPGTAERERQWTENSWSSPASATTLAATRDRILADINDAATLAAIDAVISGSTVDLALIKGAGPKTYERLMERATARKNELLSGV